QMKTHRIVFTVALVLSITLAAARASAADVHVLCSNGLKAVFEELAPQFEKASGNKVVVKFGLAAALKQQIDAGETYDVAILTPALVDEVIKSGKMAADSKTVIARSGLGIMVRAGARKPDVRSTESFKKALLGAKSIAYAKEGASGILFAALIQRLGMTETLK